MKANITKWFLDVLMIALLASAGKAQLPERDPPLSKDKPLFEVDLRKFGYERFDAKKAVRPVQIRIDFHGCQRSRSGVGDSRRLTGTQDNRRRRAEARASTGSTGRRQNRPEARPAGVEYPSMWFGFLGLQDGTFVTCTGNTVHLFSATFELVRERVLAGNSCPSFESQGVSPSRRSLLLSYLPRDGVRAMELRDTQTFEVISNWAEVPGKPGAASASDHWIAGLCGDPADLCVRGVGQAWRPLHIASKDANTKVTRAPVQFVGNDTLVIEGRHVVVATVDGETLFAVAPPKGRFAISVKSTGGSRFAVVEGRMRGLKSESLDMYPFLSADRAVVYSLSDRRVIYALKLEGTSPWAPWAIHFDDLAISPDGNLLAVVSDGILKVYRLPQ